MSNVEINPQDILNDLQGKITAAEVRESYAKAETLAWHRRTVELEAIVDQLNKEINRLNNVEEEATVIDIESGRKGVE